MPEGNFSPSLGLLQSLAGEPGRCMLSLLKSLAGEPGRSVLSVLKSLAGELGCCLPSEYEGEEVEVAS